MSLRLIESGVEKARAQRALIAALHKDWGRREVRVIAWRPSSRKLPIIHNGRYWFAAHTPENNRAIQYWNSYGSYRNNGKLGIAVEVNVPQAPLNRRIAGFFARDDRTGVTYLMHDGAVGGGGKGFSREKFLAWSNPQLVPVISSRGDSRPGVLVAQVGSKITARHLGRFVQDVIDFKRAVREGRVSLDGPTDAERAYKDYYREFSGKKRRRFIREGEYISRHGEIVEALQAWRRHHARTNERLVKNVFIDLGIQIDDRLAELYEVKPNCDRQTLYSGIGQILVYDDSADGNACRRFLVLPHREQIPPDIMRALKRAGISLLRFAMATKGVRIIQESTGN